MTNEPLSSAAGLSLWVGTYAANGGRGLYPLTQDAAGKWSAGTPFEGAANASFATWSRRCRVHYLVDEQRGMICALRRDEDGWSLLAEVPSGGSQPCYLSLDDDQLHLAVANYGNGSIGLFSLDSETGLPRSPGAIRRNSGKGPNSDRQDGPHAHCACFSPDQRWLYQVDLGTDEILAFSRDPGMGEHECAYQAPPGSGPRHLLFHSAGNRAFLISELASTIDLLEVEGRRLSSRQRLSTLPSGFSGDSLGGHIGTNRSGDRVYVTNRGHDSLAVFAFDGERLALLQHVPSGGASPRHFLLLEEQRLLLVANEEGGNVTVFSIEPDGMLRPGGIDVAVPGAVFLFPDHQFHMVPSSRRATGSDAAL